jgi:hypothetical protein
MKTRLGLAATLIATVAALPVAALAATTLTVSAPATAAFAVTLNGTDQTPVVSLAVPVNYTSPSKNTQATSGWQLTATSTVFTGTNISHTLPTTATTVSVADDASCSGANCSNPSNTVTYPLTLPAGTVAPAAVAIVNAAPGSGVGSNTETVQLSVAIPANTYADKYKSTLTFAVIEGP